MEVVVALLMFVNFEIKEARLQVDGMAMCLRGKREADNIDGSRSIKKLIIE